jgi:acyl carrier protein
VESADLVHGAAVRLGYETRETTMTDAIREQVRQVLGEHARLPVDVSVLSDDADLFQAGMTSHASVNVMLALEDSFDVEFPDSMLRRSVFESVEAIADAIEQITLKAA